MLKEIVFTTLEDQGRHLRDYVRSLTPLERLAYLYQLNLRAYGHYPRTKTQRSSIINVMEMNEDENLEEFLQRKNKSKA